ncbi:MAG: DUF484 family protein [Gammaproteobacteria bacterium]|nr:DUF484 family protein [Gammaproteobacteria bacterium]
MTTLLQSIKKQTISEHDVKQYLANNTDFFQTHGQLLSDLVIPHDSGPAVSLVERQVSILREQKKQLKRQLQELVQIAKENDRLNKQLHKLTIALYQAESIEAVLGVSRARLKLDYKVDESNFLFFVGTGDDAVIDPSQLPSGLFDSFIDNRDPEFKDIGQIISDRKPVCGQFKPELTKTLFGDVKTDVRSAALLPLVSGSCFGLLCIGSYDVQRFHAGKGTEFLKNLAELISCSLKARL